jgi:hypothetical protein
MPHNYICYNAGGVADGLQYPGLTAALQGMRREVYAEED